HLQPFPTRRSSDLQPSGGAQGTAADIEIQAREILYLRGKLNELYAKHTGKALDQIEKDMDRDRFMSAEEAKEYGLIDHVIANLQEIDNGKKKRRHAPRAFALHTMTPMSHHTQRRYLVYAKSK